MKKGIHLLFIIAGIYCLPFCSASRKSEPITGKRLNLTDTRLQRGEEAFMTYCHKCHPHGEAGLGPALNSNPAPGFIKKFQVRNGLGVMPSFKKDEISRSELRDIIKYMKVLKRM